MMVMIIHSVGWINMHRQVEETSRLETRVVELVEEVEARGRETERLMHTQAATETSLQQATSLSDALKTDNFILSRHLRNVRTEKDELLEESRKAGYLVTKLQQNLNTRDTEIQKLTAEVSMLERLTDQLKAAEHAARSVADERQRAVQYAEAEKVGLTRLLHQEENTNKELHKEIEEGQAGSAVVTTQLARRNDEVRALRERVKLLEHVLHKGDKDYNSRIQDIKTLTNEVNSLRDERQVLGRHVKLVEALKVELVRLQRELISSQNKRAVLEEEIIRREKSHRWTTLKASDPSKYDLLKKNHLLQKRLVAATQRLAASEGEIAHKERELEEMRRVVERSASHHSDAAAKPHLISQLRAKDDQIKSVTAALNVALLAQEEAEQERRHLRNQLAVTMRKMACSRRGLCSTSTSFTTFSLLCLTCCLLGICGMLLSPDRHGHFPPHYFFLKHTACCHKLGFIVHLWVVPHPGISLMLGKAGLRVRASWEDSGWVGTVGVRL
ncbi:Cilia- and flagella-associated protein 58 [Portunus trituberculatus]|uniref:Cilia-and flagella-associated protein 58 n=1 Tax=Portunus trituberculatus TaxID=210409 RepID=A0A5B7D932_PORTR|nr:Cilia- and flagella-associated protein 58 [Portunus trituberculatus]